MTTPRPGDFFLAPIPGNVGAGIRFGQWLNGEGFLPYQHAGILLDEYTTIEAMPGGAILGDYRRWKPEELRWSTDLVDLTDTQRVNIVHLGMKLEGLPYSFLDYGSLALHRFHVPFPGLKRYIDSSGHMICSQLVDYVYAKCDVHLFRDGRWPGYVTPASLDMLLDSIEFEKTAQGI